MSGIARADVLSPGMGIEQALIVVRSQILTMVMAPAPSHACAPWRFRRRSRFHCGNLPEVREKFSPEASNRGPEVRLNSVQIAQVDRLHFSSRGSLAHIFSDPCGACRGKSVPEGSILNQHGELVRKIGNVAAFK
jgi:hypothetical protein